jgi:hypothetical protein
MGKKIKTADNRGYLLVQVLVFGAIAVVIVSGLVAYAIANAKLGRRIVLSEQAFQMAEAGLEYYRWHLAHAPADYKDGTGLPGPYVKNFYNKSGVLVGTFTLTITPPDIGSTLVTVKSVGVPRADPTVSRTLVAKLAIASFANFAAVTDAAMRFGEGTEVFGPIHSNNGLRFDGIAHNLVTSFLSSYDDPDHNETGTDPLEFGVHTHVNPPPGSGVNDLYRPLEHPPNPVPARPDVFIAGRSFPAPRVNFGAITSDLLVMKTASQAGGSYFGASGALGYKLVLKTNDTFDLYRVNTLQPVPVGCPAVSSQLKWGTWSASTTTFMANYPLPSNGLIFFGDNIWVEGQVDTARVTIVAANLPDNPVTARKSVTINNNIRYTHYDGSDVVALIGQENVNIGMNSAPTLRIDAALVAQTGRVGRYHYASGCAPYAVRDTLTLYGTLVTAERYGFAYAGGFGYNTRNLTYDFFLLYRPPPFFPKTEDFHEVISWKEI